MAITAILNSDTVVVTTEQAADIISTVEQGPTGPTGPTGATGPSGLGSAVAAGTYQAASVTVSGGQITALANNPITSASTGAANAGNVAALNALGLVDLSMTSSTIKFRAYRNAAFSLVAGQTTIPLDTITYNASGAAILQTNGTLLVPTAGYYMLSGVVGIHPTASGTDVTAGMVIQKNGGNNGESIYGFQGRIDGVYNNANMSASGLMHLTPTDVVRLSLYVQTATTLFTGYSSFNFITLYGPV